MNRTEFMRDYWRYYRTLEEKLIATSTYVEIDVDNYTAFSNEYALLLQSTGAELDNFFKVYCGFQLSDRKNISDYAQYLLTTYADIVNQMVIIPDRAIALQPFKGWDIDAPAKSLLWWQDFDHIKHNRVENKKDANQKNVLNMLAALYLLEMKYLGIIAAKDSDGHPNEPDVPDDKSRLFELKGWNFRYIPMGDAFAIVDGCVCQVIEE